MNRLERKLFQDKLVKRNALNKRIAKVKAKGEFRRSVRKEIAKNNGVNPKRVQFTTPIDKNGKVGYYIN